MENRSRCQSHPGLSGLKKRATIKRQIKKGKKATKAERRSSQLETTKFLLFLLFLQFPFDGRQVT